MPLPAETCYTALKTRDARFDGVFYTGVLSTGIYCRPVCPARTPAEKSCQFYPTASAAEAAGFRPCLRCRPELAPGSRGTTLAEALLTRLQERAVDGTRLEDLDRELGLSSRQVRRLLASEFGVTPLQVVQTSRLLLAKQLLKDTSQPISEIALTSGFRSLRRFNALFRERYGLTPQSCRSAQAPSGESIQLRLAYRAPLAWQALLDYFRSRLVPGVESIHGSEYRRTVHLGEASGWLQVQPDKTASYLTVQISPSLARHLGTVQARLRRMFDLDAQPEAIHQVLAPDPLLAPIVTAFPGLRVGGAWDTFELAVRAVLGQQITVAAATTLSGRLAARLSSPVETPFPELHQHAIRAEKLVHLTMDDLCRLGLVQARAKSLLHLAAFALDGGLDFAPGTDHEDAVARLVALPGIGPWTAHYIAMRALRFPDAFPAADLGLRKALGSEGEMVSTKQAELLSQAWRPWRAYAAAYLWKSLSPGQTVTPAPTSKSKSR